MLANYYSVIYTTMRATMKGDLGDADTAGSPAHKLFRVRRKLFGKLTLLLPSLRAHAGFQRFEPTLGGEFPADLYQDIIQRSQRYVLLTLRTTLLTYLSQSQLALFLPVYISYLSAYLCGKDD